MTRAGVLYDPTTPVADDDLYAADWERQLDPIPAPGHRPGCMWARLGVPAQACSCTRPL